MKPWWVIVAPSLHNSLLLDDKLDMDRLLRMRDAESWSETMRADRADYLIGLEIREWQAEMAMIEYRKRWP